MPHSHLGDAVVVAPLVGETKVLLVEEYTKPEPRYWKFMSERFKEGDQVLDALVRGLAQEYGLKDLMVTLDSAGQRSHVRGIKDPRILDLRELAKPEMLTARYSPFRRYKRYFWGIKTADSVIEALSDKTLRTPGEKEVLHTKWFYLGALDKLNVLPDHRTLIERLLVPQLA